jgi:hypothetical protein
MKVTISGTRDGEPWPEKGGVVDLPDGEAKQLVASGLATTGDEGDAPEETATAPGEPEKATGRRKPMTKSTVEK